MLKSKKKIFDYRQSPVRHREQDSATDLLLSSINLYKILLIMKNLVILNLGNKLVCHFCRSLKNSSFVTSLGSIRQCSADGEFRSGCPVKGSLASCSINIWKLVLLTQKIHMGSPKVFLISAIEYNILYTVHLGLKSNCVYIFTLGLFIYLGTFSKAFNILS